MFARLVFFICLLIVLTPWVNAPAALVFGLIFGLTLTHPYRKPAQKTSKYLLQACVVGLGFGMNLHEVLRAGASGFIYTALGIVFVLAAGWLLGRLFRVAPTGAYLISVGTAICGGSAIAAVGPAVGAKDDEMTVSLGTVFLLNAIALLIFPSIGAAFGLSQTQFGLWAALAIHDTSSVVGAGAKYGAVALAVATTIKLARALWIVPLTLATAAVRRHKAAVQWPWFILLFLVAALINTYLPAGAPAYAALTAIARKGLAVTLFLIGSGITRTAIRNIGAPALALGVLLWLIVSAVSLALIRFGWLSV